MAVTTIKLSHRNEINSCFFLRESVCFRGFLLDSVLGAFGADWREAFKVGDLGVVRDM